MRVTTNSRIAMGEGFVKSQHPQAHNKTRKTQTPSGVSRRPDVLSKMPQSVNVLFDVLRFSIDADGRYQASIRDLASITRLSHQTVWRGLRRLRGAHLIQLIKRGTGGRNSVYQLLWRSPLASFPQKLVTPFSSLYPEREASNHSRTNVPVSTKAQRWAMSKIREELKNYEISWQRKNFILSGLGAALWRSLKRGEVKAGRQLGQVVREIIDRLRDALAIGNSLRSWCSWGGWAVRGVIDDERARRARDMASAQLIARIQREKEAAKAAWATASFSSWRDLLPVITAEQP